MVKFTLEDVPVHSVGYVIEGHNRYLRRYLMNLDNQFFLDLSSFALFHITDSELMENEVEPYFADLTIDYISCRKAIEALAKKGIKDEVS